MRATFMNTIIKTRTQFGIPMMIKVFKQVRTSTEIALLLLSKDTILRLLMLILIVTKLDWCRESFGFFAHKRRETIKAIIISYSTVKSTCKGEHNNVRDSNSTDVANDQASVWIPRECPMTCFNFYFCSFPNPLSLTPSFQS